MKRFIFRTLDQYSLKSFGHQQWKAGVQHGVECEQQRIIDILQDESVEVMMESPDALFGAFISDVEFKLPDGNDVVEVNFAHMALKQQLARFVELIKGEK